MGALFLSVGATAAWAATDDLNVEGDGTELLERVAKKPDRPAERKRQRGHGNEGTSESRRTESVSSLRATLQEERIPEDPEPRPEPEWAAAEDAATAGVPTAALEAIASCESGGDPTAVSANGTYRGKYQFATGTWASVGGSGDPAAAPEAEQDYRASLLYRQAGTSPWPNCG